ncbi:L-aspartate oxidase [Desulfosudis oleivorans]|uniref:L-aspartate oxidase n=1 Tax=Desulfosudis oleivorans (strain DSM 6200 / JCM 39069 / Hxd3) TaxID=96561 RepID=A8ZZE1_DESOH|nr:L-aspartate oxidase [Desulfosudis oleivorans]ABW67294.1 L-aspartate oxidase [Desulfosudis oleivorans Hxd3]
MEHQTDFLVIGSGIAGLKFALKAAEAGSVTIVTKKAVADSNTNRAQGGIAAVTDGIDSFDAHIQDTLSSGDGLCKREVVEHVVKNGPAAIQELVDLGINFTMADNGQHLDLGREGGHSHNRIVHAHDLTGREIEQALVALVREHPNITVLEDHIAVDLITHATRVRWGPVVKTQSTYCCGAYVLDRVNDYVKTFHARITLLATGGAGKVYAYTSNPDIATGDGIAMAYRAGCTVANLEFMQFHPTCLYHPAAKNYLISEAVRGEGGVLVDSAGHAFMEKYDPARDLACRDVVARAIDTEMKQSGDDCVFLDISHKNADFIRTRFPNLYANCLKFGIDMTKEPVPVVPAAHYMCGGVVTDMAGKTDIDRLYAVGETACTGLHGANRLASNSLLEAVVFADSAAKDAINRLAAFPATKEGELPLWDEAGTTDSTEVITVSHNWDEIRLFMWNYVGIVRSDKRLKRARNRIDLIQAEIREYYWDFRVTSNLIELRNIATVGELIIQCAMLRKESRGLHYNLDYDFKDDARWNMDTVIKRPYSDQ